jgi:hypothetical protein
VSGVPVLNTVNVGTNRTLIYGAKGSNAVPLMLLNTSTTTTVWVGFDQSIMVGSGPVVALTPGSALGFDGTISIYGIASAPVPVAVIPSGSYAPGTITVNGNVIATVTGDVNVVNTPTVSISGTPTIDVAGNVDVIGQGGYILPGSVANIFNSSGSVFIPNNSGYIVPIGAGGFVDVTQYSSYDINMSFVDTLQSTAGHPLTLQVELNWYDDLVTGIPIFTEIWNPWVISQAPTTLQGVIGSGPMHGKYMTAGIINNSGFQVTMPYFNLFGSGRPIPLADWRMCHGNHVNDHTRSEIQTIGLGYENSLADTGGLVNLAASTSYWIPLFMYAGPVAITLQNQVANTITTAQLVDVGTNNTVSGSLASIVGLIYNFTSAGVLAAGAIEVAVQLPRSACGLIIATNATGGGMMSFKAVAQQGP